MPLVTSSDAAHLMSDTIFPRKAYGLVLLTGILSIYLLYSLYRKALPKPIPGIPYNPKALKRILGDLPELASAVVKTGDLATWLQSQADKHESPVCQIFLRPMSPPVVILSDFREMQDLCMRRKEFDRGRIIKDIFRGPTPNHHITLDTGDEWKAHRRLLQDLMSPPFLQNVAAPAIYSNIANLIDLWRQKTRIADGRPFDASEDIFYAALDAVTAFSFGEDFPHNATRPVADLIQGLDSTQLSELRTSGTIDDPVEFPSVLCDEVLSTILDVSIAIERLHGSPWPVLKWKIIEKFPPVNRTVRLKNEFVVGELNKATSRQLANGDDDSWMRSAVDLMVSREKKLARDDNRLPDFLSPTMRDELFGILTGGHDTTSTTMLWGLKLLADHPSIQSKLRASMETEYRDASKEARTPSVEEIMRIKVPYLDATMEEILRCAGTAPLVEREASCDTVLLGYPIPKGTKIFFLAKGASIQKPAYEIDETRRNETCRIAVKNRGRVPEWDPADIATFKPDRWLTSADPSEKNRGGSIQTDAVVELEFDSTAGPQIAFGQGRRSCFGKRLAYVELRILVSLIVWNFEILECPEALSGYEGKDVVTHKPIKNYVRLRNIQR
ncbi:cytochrome P450 [Colletotrichum orchidophilum]|uniref:Cytochrome P450 n=1 Tax=Colletotrichum orchidophilum TaxID=1209926 RepID=A0A1G4BLT9_9PEZI|nr:cytochrome P450 [Colletotrichum orchidophilum]OHF02267.1 cytochrome P450 [Colletotrichum orchidophilum]